MDMHGQQNGGGRGLLMGAVKGAIAGAAAAWVMDRVTWAMYESADPVGNTPEERRREKDARVEGKFVPQAAAAKVSRAAGLELSDEQNFWAGQGVHYLLGIAPGVAYGMLRDRVPYMGAGRGLLYGAALTVVMDEAMGPALGIASDPRKYPLRTHARGLVAHLVAGAIMDTVLDVLDEAIPDGRRDGAAGSRLAARRAPAERGRSAAYGGDEDAWGELWEHERGGAAGRAASGWSGSRVPEAASI